MKKFNYLNVFIKCDSWLQNKIKEFNGVDDLPFWCSMLSALLDWGYKREAGRIIDSLLEKQDFFRSENNTVNRIEMMAKLGGGVKRLNVCSGKYNYAIEVVARELSMLINEIKSEDIDGKELIDVLETYAYLRKMDIIDKKTEEKIEEGYESIKKKILDCIETYPDDIYLLLRLGNVLLQSGEESNTFVKGFRKKLLKIRFSKNKLLPSEIFILFRLLYLCEEYEKGKEIFCFVCGLQNKNGSWNISNRETQGLRFLFAPRTEQKESVKEFLDALTYKNRTDMEMFSPTFLDSIGEDDGRLLVIKEIIHRICNSAEGGIRILDAGAGKGRYLFHLKHAFPTVDLNACDISDVNRKHKNFEGIKWKYGSLTDMPYPDNMFDCVYTCETLEHCYHVSNALNELIRIVKKGGKLIVIDKNVKLLGKLRLGDGEQWFEDTQIIRLSEEMGCDLEIKENIEYEMDHKRDGLFSAWIFTK